MLVGRGGVRWLCELGWRGLRAARLKSKALFKLVGPDTWDLLQGLTTNDLGLLKAHPPPSAIYTLFLNSKGRVLHDSFLYAPPTEGELWVECDAAAFPPLQAHIRTYRMRKKVEVVPLDGQFEPWSLWGGVGLSEGLEGVLVSDPRLKELGSRLLLPKGINLVDQLKEKGVKKVEEVGEEVYTAFRYRLGVGEGGAEIPWATSFPLEMNCDLLGGVSFQKGCYIGQELTARTHHTGVVRKRLMPLFFEGEEGGSLAFDTPVEAEPGGKLVGKLKGVAPGVGLALLRVSEALNAQHLKVGGLKATTERPSWWPPLSSKH